MNDVRFHVRVHVDVPARPDAFFDLTNLDCDSEQHAIGYAIQLSTECFGLPLRKIRARVISSIPIIDC